MLQKHTQNLPQKQIEAKLQEKSICFCWLIENIVISLPQLIVLTIKKNNFIMKKRILKLSIAAIFLSGIMISCEETKDERTEVTKGTSIVMKSNPGTPISILQIKRGKRKGKWPHHYCEGKTGICLLWFQGPAQPSYPFVESFIDDKDIYFVVNYSNADDEEKAFWMEDVKAGLVEIGEDIVLDDEEFLKEINYTKPITIRKGKYKILSSEKETYSFKVSLK